MKFSNVSGVLILVLHSISTYGVLHSRTLEIALQGTRNSTAFWSAALHLHKGVQHCQSHTPAISIKSTWPKQPSDAKATPQCPPATKKQVITEVYSCTQAHPACPKLPGASPPGGRRPNPAASPLAASDDGHVW